MTRPTPELLKETDYVLNYLLTNKALGITYSTGTTALKLRSRRRQLGHQVHLRLDHRVAERYHILGIGQAIMCITVIM